MSDESVILRTQAVGKSFGRFRALAGISCEFHRGRLTAIIGPNGAGKSTYFNLLSGALRPSAGRIYFEGRDITGLAQSRFAALGIAKSFQITSIFPELTVHENVRAVAQARDIRLNFWRARDAYPQFAQEAEALLARVGLSDRAGVIAGRLAHGEQRALEIAMALASRPRLLLLDEPTAGMSPEETAAMMTLIAGLVPAHTVILVEHKMKLVMGIAERVLVLHHGEVLAIGTPEDIRANAEVRRVYLGQREV
ncbi:MAG: ABC transporter ATP-binding protein [Acidibrevibacterium sp.]|jgi:branched-chain amino acid transport system ATP-binding protein|uniref:ABC transporter ATP-binding protein n=1 Tax=Acidibrevibacterium fodinaquatile TaxID=1969806 RepID=UPI0023A89720|nr:ABC transporter ATP-binding protein [Acidibrevibacterium fodinaquatile]MCA7120145.1 ABC transporter ATP-binding protein [Acidibrevibacterium fodinaquatile]